jgi:hypothetical protein
MIKHVVMLLNFLKIFCSICLNHTSSFFSRRRLKCTCTPPFYFSKKTVGVADEKELSTRWINWCLRWICMTDKPSRKNFSLLSIFFMASRIWLEMWSYTGFSSSLLYDYRYIHVTCSWRINLFQMWAHLFTYLRVYCTHTHIYYLFIKYIKSSTHYAIWLMYFMYVLQVSWIVQRSSVSHLHYFSRSSISHQFYFFFF